MKRSNWTWSSNRDKQQRDQPGNARSDYQLCSEEHKNDTEAVGAVDFDRGRAKLESLAN
eukprot:CAMPEP_0185829622 /NCGR_PEP_ID=MMETSP1353-20130828/361_1 /TAXON_ID=1077150 /ORGANISM="Erythrolobus australicus, Strain CCMP3124" /LENGTH=58 /DNA_ID=CAMNT_0028527439 /DNA_START=672 /DNA_END=848 /DNA_ORIENTATION=+